MGDLSLVLFIYSNSIISYNCTESFSDTATEIRPTATCPSGGKIHEKKMCSDKIKATYGCFGKYHLEPDGLCYGDHSYHAQGYYPDNYYNDYDTNNGTCVRKYGKPTLTCPNGYDLIVKNKNYVCSKKK